MNRRILLASLVISLLIHALVFLVRVPASYPRPPVVTRSTFRIVDTMVIRETPAFPEMPRESVRAEKAEKEGDKAPVPTPPTPAPEPSIVNSTREIEAGAADAPPGAPGNGETESEGIPQAGISEVPVENPVEGILNDPGTDTLPDSGLGSVEAAPLPESVPAGQTAGKGTGKAGGTPSGNGSRGNGDGRSEPPPEAASEIPSEPPKAEQAPQTVAAGNGKEFVPFYNVDSKPEFVRAAVLEYPLQAKRLNLEATVIVEADIDEEGRVTDTRIKKKAGFGFDEAAQSYIMGSAFSPALKGDRPVPVRAVFTVKFSLRN